MGLNYEYLGEPFVYLKDHVIKTPHCVIVMLIYPREFFIIGTKTCHPYWSRDKMAGVSQTTLSNAFSWMKMLEFRLRFHWSLFLRVQLTIFHHWFRYICIFEGPCNIDTTLCICYAYIPEIIFHYWNKNMPSLLGALNNFISCSYRQCL